MCFILPTSILLYSFQQSSIRLGLLQQSSFKRLYVGYLYVACFWLRRGPMSIGDPSKSQLWWEWGQIAMDKLWVAWKGTLIGVNPFFVGTVCMESLCEHLDLIYNPSQTQDSFKYSQFCWDKWIVLKGHFHFLNFSEKALHITLTNGKARKHSSR